MMALLSHINGNNMAFEFFKDGLILFDEYQFTNCDRFETISGIYNLNVKVKDKIYQAKFAVVIKIENKKMFIPEVYLPNLTIPYKYEHVYKNNNNLCCLGLNYEIELCWGKNRTFYNFLTKILDPFLVNYLEYSATGNYINGDRPHAKDGLIEYYSQFFLNENYNIIIPILLYCHHKILRNEFAKGNNPCPCGSGKNIRHCNHQTEIREFINTALNNAYLKNGFISDMKNYLGDKNDKN